MVDRADDHLSEDPLAPGKPLKGIFRGFSDTGTAITGSFISSTAGKRRIAKAGSAGSRPFSLAFPDDTKSKSIFIW